MHATPFIEAVGMTHMGNGSIHLLDFDGNECFSYPFLDYHNENMYFNAVRDIEVFKHYKPQANEEYSRIIEGGTLHIDYSHFDQELLRIFGIVTYRAENEQCNTEKTIGSIAVERLFKKRSNTKSAVAAPEADSTMHYILIRREAVIVKQGNKRY